MSLCLTLYTSRTGAIIRAKLDRNESGSETPVITYEKFVEELSSGDAFATSMIDALVEVRFYIPQHEKTVQMVNTGNIRPS